MVILRANFPTAVRTFLAACTLCMIAALAQAASLAQFDINGGGGPTQAGFEPVTGPGAPATQNGITFSFECVGHNCQDRDRGTGGNVALSPVPDVTRDFQFAEGNFSNRHLKASLSGLMPSTKYSFRWHHYEGFHNPPDAHVAVYYAPVPGDLLFETGLYGNNTTNFFTDFTTTTNSQGELRLATVLHSQAPGSNVSILNGFEVRGVTGSLPATPLASFDVNGGGGPTQAGFVELPLPPLDSQRSPSSATTNGITIQLFGGSFDRDRDTGGNVASSPVPDVTRDFRAGESPGQSDAMRVWLSGLSPNTSYDLRWHHYENAHDGAGNMLAVRREHLLFQTAETHGNLSTNFFTDFEAITDASGNLSLQTGMHFYGLHMGQRLNGFEVLGLAAGIPGDFDSNGRVDADDFTTWRTGFGTASGATLSSGDADGDADVDGRDFLVWQQNFGAGASSSVSSAAVPEPGSIFLSVLGILAAGMSVRRKPFRSV